jgi:hypothetical protein
LNCLICCSLHLQSDPNVTQLRLNYYCTNISEKKWRGMGELGCIPENTFWTCMYERWNYEQILYLGKQFAAFILS